ncbi:T9SS type A sorting domain-containing protein [bacterium]|nr:T9SS type A sorting domain-containing protein [bacterium]
MTALKFGKYAIGLLLLATSPAFATVVLPISIPEHKAGIDIIADTPFGLTAAFDFSSFWNKQSECTGDEVFSTWIVLPEHGAAKIDVIDASPLVEVNLGKPVILRGVRLATLNIRPSIYRASQYEPINNVKVQISASGSGINEVAAPKSVKSLRKLFDALTVNPAATNGIDDFDQEHLLVICPDFAEGNISNYVEWKRRKGIEVTVSTLSDIGISSTNDIGLKNYIQQAYETWVNPPDFVLLAGDETVLPVHMDFTDDPTTIFSTASVPGWYSDENWFVCVDGDDFFPDIIMGRWIVNTEYEYIYMSEKIKTYEMTPNLTLTDWYEHAVVTAQDIYYYQGDPSMRETKLQTQQMMYNAGISQVDTLFSMTNPYQLVQWMTEGRSFLNYRGSGWTMGWAGLNFYIDMVYEIQNTFMLPTVTGIGCGVTLFVEPDECFGEAWMLQGTVNNQKGAITFVGPTWNTHTFFNNELDLGLYQSLFEEGEPRTSTALIAGKMAMYDYFDDYFIQDPNIEEIVRVAFNQYHTISDPELAPYSAIPEPLSADPPITVLNGSQSITITVTDQYGFPFEGAQVCLYAPDDFQTADLTGPDGTVTLTSQATQLPGYVYVTATAHNKAAFVDSMLIITASQYVLHYDYIIDDSQVGNNDGGLSPGEDVEWVEVLKNYGVLSALDVHAVMSSSHPEVTITQGEASFGDIAQSATATSIPNYALSVAAEPYIIGDEIEIQLDITDAADSSWTSIIILPLLTPDMTVLSFDPDPTGNDRLDRGETANLSFSLRNDGTSAMDDATLELSTDDEYIEILEGSAPLGSVGIGSMVFSGSSPFVIAVSPYTPTLHEVTFEVTVVSNQATYTFEDSEEFTFEVDEYGEVDPTASLNFDYYAYESSDYLFSEAPDFVWFELDPDSGGPGQVLPFSNSDQLINVDLPFTFTYWGQNFEEMTVSADGWVQPGSVSTVSPINYDLPHFDDVAGMIAALWDDLWNTDNEEGRILHYYDENSGCYYIEYNYLSHHANAATKETFQIVLCDPAVEVTATGDGEILFYYKSLHMFGILFTTAGIESVSQTDAISLCFNNNTPITASGLRDSLAVKFTPDPPEITGIRQLPPTAQHRIIPTDFVFNPAYPNPFNPSTTLNFTIPISGVVELNVFNVRGQLVDDLQSGQLQPGYYSLNVDASDWGSGIYFARLDYQGQSHVQKLLLVK